MGSPEGCSLPASQDGPSPSQIAGDRHPSRQAGPGQQFAFAGGEGGLARLFPSVHVSDRPRGPLHWLVDPQPTSPISVVLWRCRAIIRRRNGEDPVQAPEHADRPSFCSGSLQGSCCLQSECWPSRCHARHTSVSSNTITHRFQAVRDTAQNLANMSPIRRQSLQW